MIPKGIMFILLTKTCLVIKGNLLFEFKTIYIILHGHSIFSMKTFKKVSTAIFYTKNKIYSTYTRID